MSKRHGIWSFAVLLLALSAAWGQDSSAQPSSAQQGSAQSPAQQPADDMPTTNPQQPVPAFGQNSPTPSISENPPISGLDLPNLEPHGAPLSYLQAGAHISESVDSNVENSLGGSATRSISRGLGSLDLQRLWSNYDLSLNYLGGVGYYDVKGLGFKQIEELGFQQKITWKRGQLGIRDAFSYQPEGTFGSSYGSVSTTGAGLQGSSTFLNGQGLGELGQVPRIMNIAALDLVETLTPKSSVTVTGGYGFVHFLGNDPDLGTSFIGNSQVSGEIGYNRVLGPHDQAAIVYAYRGFQFSTGVNFHSHVIQLMWGHRISGRMDFLISAGPQFTQINNLDTVVGPENDLRIGAAGRVSLRYRFPRLVLELSYQHYLTTGSGFFAGAESDIVRLTASHPLTRVWTLDTDIGYSRNSRVLPVTCPEGQTCPGVSADIYQYGFAGFSVHRMFGRNYRVYASYQFNGLEFDNSYCTAATAGETGGPCNRTSQRHIGTIGFDWTPRPIRLD
jgi:hypothetical protein